MDPLKYEVELINALTELSVIMDKESELINQKEQLRGAIKKWLIVNKLTSYTTVDLNNQSWSLSLSEQVRTTLDKKAAKELLSENIFNSLLKTTTVETFKCQKIGKKSNNLIPESPSENI